MSITHCIAYSISRSTSTAPVELKSGEALVVDGALDELLRDLKHAYLGKAGKQFGYFDRDLSKSLLSQWMRQFREEKLGFEGFASKAAEHLRHLLAETEVVVDGYLLVALETLAESESAYFYFLLPQEAVWLDGDLRAQRTHFIDVRGVSAAAKVDLLEWAGEGETPYLSVLRARGEKEFTDCFHQWVAFADARDCAAETKVFLDIVADYSQKLAPEKAQVCRTQVIDYCLEQDKKGEAVVIRELSEHLRTELQVEETDDFASFVAAQRETPPLQLHPERRQLKQFIRISGRNDHLSMSFAADCLGDSIVYHKESDSLTIKNLPSPLKMRLIQYLQKLDEQVE